MGDSQKRILVASLLGVVLMGTAFWSSQKYNTKTPPQRNDESIFIVKREHIPVIDSDADGIPDWQSRFFAGPPIIISENASTTPYKIPDTLTARHGIEFFENVLTAEAYGALGATQETIVNNSIEKLQREAQDILYRPSGINVTQNNSPEFLRSYGNLVSLIILNNQSGGEHEYEIFVDAFNRQDTERLKDLERPYANYENIENALLDVSVPEGYSKEHLDIVNAFLALKNDVGAMQVVFDDPLYTLIRYKRYSSDVLGMTDTLVQLYSALYLQDGIRFSGDEPVLRLVEYYE